MADESRTELEFRLRTTSDNSGIDSYTKSVDASTVAVERMTAATKSASTAGGAIPPLSPGGGMATPIPNLQAYDSAINQVIITSEKEYLQTVKTLEAYQAKRFQLELLGKDTTALAVAIAQLDGALSTESALTVADTMEKKALAAASAEAAGAINEETVAITLNSRALMEVGTVARELTTGNINRLPGSLAILATNVKGLGLSLAELTPILLGGFVAFEIGKNIYKDYEKTVNNLRESIHAFSKEQEAANFHMQEGMTKSRDAVRSFNESLDETINKVETVSQRLEEMNRIQADSTKLLEAHAKLQEEAALEAASGIQDQLKRAQAEYDIKEKFAKQERDLADAEARNQFKNQQTSIDTATGNLEKQRSETNALSDDMLSKQNALFRTQEERKRQQSLYGRFQKDLGLSDADLDVLKGNDIQAAIAKIKAELDKGGGGMGFTRGQADVIGDIFTKFGIDQKTMLGGFANPLAQQILALSGAKGSQMGLGPFASAGVIEKAPEFASSLNELLGLRGGKGGSDIDQDKRVYAAQQAYDEAEEKYKRASTAADAMATELNSLTGKLKEMGESLNSASALRNEQLKETQVKDLEDRKRALQEQLKNEEGLVSQGFRGQMPEVVKLQAQIKAIDAWIQAIAVKAPAASSMNLSSDRPTASPFAPSGHPSGKHSILDKTDFENSFDLHLQSVQAYLDTVSKKISEFSLSVKQHQSQISSN